jgi:hypothetical protein
MQIDFINQEHQQKFRPMLEIEVSDIVPSSLHTFLGVGTNAIDKLEELATKTDPAIYNEIQEIFRRHHVDKQAYFNKYHGKFHFKNLENSLR